MRPQPMTNLIFRSQLVLAFALAFWSPVRALSAETAERKPMAETTMMDRCPAMMEQQRQLTEDGKADDAALIKQLSRMNSSPEDQKITLMAAILTQMVEQRITMDARKTTMDEGMMQHMTQHMSMSQDSMSQDSMAHCPMMKGMNGMTADNMMDRCQAMKEQQRQLTEDGKDQDVALTERLARMNSAPERMKLSLMAAIVTDMVEQRIAMDARKATMKEEMMQHMMQHMQMGKDSTSQCPMMQGMAATPEN